MDSQILKPLAYGNRLRKYVLISNYLDTLSTKGNLKDAVLKIQMATFENILNDFEVKNLFRPDLDPKLKKEALVKLRKLAEDDTRRDIEDYLPIIFNQILVTVCTVLDNYLYDCLNVITTNQPQVLKSLATDDDIKITDLVDSKDYQEIFAKVQSVFLDKFDFKSIKDKMSFLKNKLSIDVDTALYLKLHNNEIQVTYSSGLQFLVDVYKKRNDVVHRDSKSLKTYAELSYISNYVDAFMLDLGIVLGKQFHIPVDFVEFIRNAPKEMNPQIIPKT